MVFQSLPFDKLPSTGSGRSRANGLKNEPASNSGQAGWTSEEERPSAHNQDLNAKRIQWAKKKGFHPF
jgi:hypothetical protein